MEGYLYTYQLNEREVTAAIMEFLLQEMRKSESHSKAVYYMLSGMLNNSNMEQNFKDWYMNKINKAVKDCITIR